MAALSKTEITRARRTWSKQASKLNGAFSYTDHPLHMLTNHEVCSIADRTQHVAIIDTMVLQLSDIVFPVHCLISYRFLMARAAIAGLRRFCPLLAMAIFSDFRSVFATIIEPCLQSFSWFGKPRFSSPDTITQDSWAQWATQAIPKRRPTSIGILWYCKNLQTLCIS